MLQYGRPQWVRFAIKSAYLGVCVLINENNTARACFTRGCCAFKTFMIISSACSAPMPRRQQILLNLVKQNPLCLSFLSFSISANSEDK